MGKTDQGGRRKIQCDSIQTKEQELFAKRTLYKKCRKGFAQNYPLEGTRTQGRIFFSMEGSSGYILCFKFDVVSKSCTQHQFTPSGKQPNK